MKDQVNRFEHAGKTYVRENIVGCMCERCALWGESFPCAIAKGKGIYANGEKVNCCPSEEGQPFSIFIEEDKS